MSRRCAADQRPGWVCVLAWGHSGGCYCVKAERVDALVPVGEQLALL